MSIENKRLYLDPVTGQYFIGEVEKKIQEELNSRGYVSLHEVYELIAESIPDEEVRKKFLDGLDIPWVEDVGFANVYDPEFTLFTLKEGDSQSLLFFFSKLEI